MKITTLRKQLYQVVDSVLESGTPVELERKGRKLLIVPADRVKSRLARLKRRRAIIGNPDDLVKLKVYEWREPENLR